MAQKSMVCCYYYSWGEGAEGVNLAVRLRTPWWWGVSQGGATEEEVGAITVFGNLMDYHGALQRYSLQIKGRYIEVRFACVVVAVVLPFETKQTPHESALGALAGVTFDAAHRFLVGSICRA